MDTNCITNYYEGIIRPPHNIYTHMDAVRPSCGRFGCHYGPITGLNTPHFRVSLTVLGQILDHWGGQLCIKHNYEGFPQQVVNWIKNHYGGIIRPPHNIYPHMDAVRPGSGGISCRYWPTTGFDTHNFGVTGHCGGSNIGPLGMSTASKTTTRASLGLPKIYTHLWMQLDQVLAASVAVMGPEQVLTHPIVGCLGQIWVKYWTIGVVNCIKTHTTRASLDLPIIYTHIWMEDHVLAESVAVIGPQQVSTRTILMKEHVYLLYRNTIFGICSWN